MTSVARDILDVLFASVFQGTAITVLVATAVILIGIRMNAATRCVVLQTTLAATAIVPFATTLPYITPRSFMLRGHQIASSSLPDNRAVHKLASVVARRIDVVMSDEVVLTLAAAWLVGVSFFAMRIVAGTLQVARLVRRSRSLTSRSGVDVLASAEIGIPLAVGFTPPAIIIPESLAQVDDAFECIVLHELAHVRRGDAYANACERVIQALLYFNPAVWLLMRAIALEREIACDDWAVAKLRDLETYTRNLASFAVRTATRSVPPHAAAGFGHAIITRIHRLQDLRRNGGVSPALYAIGGFTLVLLTIALTINSFAPTIALASQAPPAQAIVAATACASSEARYVSGPPPTVRRRLPNGLKTLVRVSVSSSGKAVDAVLFKTSGDAAFDHAVLIAAKKGAYAPEMRDCRPLAAPYLFEAMTG